MKQTALLFDLTSWKREKNTGSNDFVFVDKQ